jgi:hypothetical protein
MSGTIHFALGGPEDRHTHWCTTQPTEGELITDTQDAGALTAGRYRVKRVITLGEGPDRQFNAYAEWEQNQPTR